MSGILKNHLSDERLTIRLTRTQKAFMDKYPLLNFSEIMRQQLDRFILTFSEEEYRRMTR